MPLPGTHVIHPRWSAHHQPTAEGGRTAVATITRAGTGDGTYNTSGPNIGQTTPPARVTIASRVKVRVQATTAADAAMVADQVVTRRPYLVAVPADVAAVLVDDLVTLDECDNDPQLVGRPLRVRDVHYGTEIWQRDLICQDDEG
jgi:hypothetical protein